LLRVGLTGGIASGKSLVLGRLASRGLGTLDLDAVAREALEPGGAAYAEVLAGFGRGILAADGRIDRASLAARVFRDETARRRLEALVHPHVRATEARVAARLAAEGQTVMVTDAALIVEVGMHLRFDRLVVADCGEEEQRRRLMARDRLPEADARARLAAQMPAAEKRRFAHRVVDTSGTVAATETTADAVAQELVRLAVSPPAPLVLPPERALGGLVHGAGPGPRGLDGMTVVGAVAAAGGLEMPAVAERMAGSAQAPWYRQARPGEAAPWPEALAGAVAVIAAARGGFDPEWAVAAAFSLSYLTHAGSEAAAGACAAALGALTVASEGRITPELPSRLSQWGPVAERWAGTSPPPRIGAALAAAAAHPHAPERARAAAAAAGAEAGFAGALVGLAIGARPAAAEPLVAMLERLRTSRR
jgi:dephospho-CoA kinase